jgi:hypothetical protein
MRKLLAGLIAGGIALAVALSGARPAQATLDMQKKAKELGFPVKDCLYCHGEKLPKKGAVTNNERGKWLVAEKEKRKAKQVDISWLKDYVEKP